MNSNFYTNKGFSFFCTTITINGKKINGERSS